MSLKLTKKITFWAKIVVLAGLVVYIGYVLRQQQFDWTVVNRQIRTVAHPERWMLALLMLTPVNWGFEALKWQILLRRVEGVNFWQAYKGVLAGVALGFALPAQLGDTAGRVLSLRTNRAGAVGASLVSGGMQFYVALVFGAAAWWHHLTVVPERNTLGGQGLLAVLAGLSGLGVVFGFVRRPLVRWLERFPNAQRYASYWAVAGQYDDREIGLALVAAAVRYLVFSAQFYIALRLLGITLPGAVAASGVGLVFLAKTMTPAFNLLSDLGVREAASLWVFAPFGIPAPVLLTATLTLWFANVLTPVLVGLIWVWKLKLTAE
ncbi:MULTISPECIES: lysylphosphatidylglycerol synthase transmembrane domain-containing protein [Spirosoma]|uniref:Flippase-like domain-containing protein n=1 Tax=Spirosoma liriopis TaxID=2937440 RepID=A0ABT0HNM3_9BACT|nr:lysylphosphatidylglycerol synthase transmembrane domain-containing protein [Spirosoma liriopis]MCK8493770.1 flippase-like domain-containing protein [Spirosoma liriopis]